jgi:hypothetical protein
MSYSKDRDNLPPSFGLINKGGSIAGEAREKLEDETGSWVVSAEDYLTESERRKGLKKKEC